MQQTMRLSLLSGRFKKILKLILFLSQSDLEKMIELRESGDSPNDCLSEMLDTHLISLSRWIRLSSMLSFT